MYNTRTSRLHRALRLVLEKSSASNAISSHAYCTHTCLIIVSENIDLLILSTNVISRLSSITYRNDRIVNEIGALEYHSRVLGTRLIIISNHFYFFFFLSFFYSSLYFHVSVLSFTTRLSVSRVHLRANRCEPTKQPRMEPLSSRWVSVRRFSIHDSLSNSDAFNNLEGFSIGEHAERSVIPPDRTFKRWGDNPLSVFVRRRFARGDQWTVGVLLVHMVSSLVSLHLPVAGCHDTEKHSLEKRRKKKKWINTNICTVSRTTKVTWRQWRRNVERKQSEFTKNVHAFATERNLSIFIQIFRKLSTKCRIYRSKISDSI